MDPQSGRAGSVHRYKRRTIRDIPLGGYACEVEIEYAETYLSPSNVRVEALSFVAPKARVTRRYAKLISGLCRHMPISTVALHTGLRWGSVKAIDVAHLSETISMPRPQTLSDIRYLGVDEVARAKGHDYLTLVYDLSPGDNCGTLLWVKEGRDAAVLSEFLDALSEECANGIEAVAIDMGLPYIAALTASLPNAAIVFDRFHVMQLFSEVIRDCRRATLHTLKEQPEMLVTEEQTFEPTRAASHDCHGLAARGC